MHLASRKIKHSRGGWNVDFIGGNGDVVRVKVAGGADLSEDEAIVRARAEMVQLTAFETCGGGRSVNRYDAASNSNFDDDQPLLDTRH
jgi:hypothetical protein